MADPKKRTWRVGWYIRGMDGEDIDPELNWGQVMEAESGIEVEAMAEHVALSLNRHAEELGKRGKLDP